MPANCMLRHAAGSLVGEPAVVRGHSASHKDHSGGSLRITKGKIPWRADDLPTTLGCQPFAARCHAERAGS